MTVWAVSLLAHGASPPSPNCRALTSGIRSLIGPVSFRTVQTFQCSTPKGNTRREPESSFGENQLLPSSVSFSLQPTTHPKMLNNLRVRSSIRISTNFNLVMGSSPGFGSDTNDERAIHTRFRCGSGWTALTRRRRVTRRSVLQKVRRHPFWQASIGLRPLCKRRVSGLFHPPCGALFTFPSRYLFTIGHRGYLALDGGPPRFPLNSTC